MQIAISTINNQNFNAQPFRLPIKTITYNTKVGSVKTQEVNWAREFNNPKAEEYYRKLQEAQKARNIAEVAYWSSMMGKYKIVDLDNISLIDKWKMRIKSFLDNLINTKL